MFVGTSTLALFTDNRRSVLIKQAVAERAARGSDPPASIAAEIGDKLPKRVSLADSTGGLDVVRKLREILSSLDDVAAHACPDGKIRNPWLLLSASEHRRRCIETALRVQHRMADIDQVEHFFHAAVIAEVTFRVAGMRRTYPASPQSAGCRLQPRLSGRDVSRGPFG